MKVRLFLFVFVLFWDTLQAQDTFQLAPPVLRFESVFFEKNAKVGVDFAMKGAQVRYTLNGQDPTEKDRRYRKPLRLDQRYTSLKTRAFRKGYLPSEVEAAEFFKSGIPVQNIHATPPNPKYPGHGPRTLVDGAGGKANFSNGSWMGFLHDTVEVVLGFAQEQTVTEVMVHVMENQPAWIFLPQKLEVYAPAADSAWILISSTLPETEKDQSKSGCKALSLPLPKACNTRQIKLKIYPLASIPAFHPGKGNPAWLFIDEINLY